MLAEKDNRPWIVKRLERLEAIAKGLEREVAYLQQEIHAAIAEGFEPEENPTKLGTRLSKQTLTKELV